MAQSRERRRQRSRRRASASPSAPPQPTPGETQRRQLRRVVIAFLIVVGLAGVLAISGSPDEPSGRAPVG